MQVLPIFKSHHSIGRSILTLEAAESSLKSGPDSIVDLAVENKFEKVVLIEDSFSGFLEAYKNLSAKNIQLVFGLRLTIIPDINDKSDESRTKEHKICFMAKNLAGYKALIKIYSAAATTGFYYEPRIDANTLKQFWSEENLSCWVPFYDSFLFKNSLYFSSCIPDFSFTKPLFLVENNGLPFDTILADKVKGFCATNGYNMTAAKSVFYAKKKDFKAFLTFKCIRNRTTLEKPELEHMSSNQFSLESWAEQQKDPQSFFALK